MEVKIENGKIINEKIPEVLDYSDQYKKEMKKSMRLNNIFSEFENKASKDFNFFIDESNRRYSKLKCGINLKGAVSATRKKCLDESKKILNDNFYNNNVIKNEKEKMKHKNNVFLYKNLRDCMNIVKNPELLKKKSDNNNNRNKNNKKYNFNYDLNSLNKNERIMDYLITEEQKSLSKSIDNYKSNLDKLKINLDNSPTSIFNKKKNIDIYRKLNLYLPNLKFMNYASRKDGQKIIDRDDPSKKADIHKLLPFSKLGKKNTEITTPPQSVKKKEEKKVKILPYITEPSLPINKQTEPPSNFQYYKDFKDSIEVVANSANKELFVKKNFDVKSGEVENVLKVDDIPDVLLYDDLAHKKANKLKEERRNKNSIICRSQNYLKLTSQQRMNLDIDKNIKLIKDIEDSYYKKLKSK